MADWACSSCRSINADRFSRCYKCKAPRELVQLDPMTTTLGPPTGAVPVDPGAPRETRPFALFAALAIWAAVVFQVLSTIWANEAMTSITNGSFSESQLERGLIFIVGFYGSVLVALVFWAAWVALVLANIPKLGAGWPAVTPGIAFFEHLVPVWNLWRAPSFIRIVFRHLPGQTGPDIGLITVWVAPLIGVIVIPRVTRYVGIFADDDGRLGLATVQSWLIVAALIVSAIAAMAILVRIEERQRLATIDPGSTPASASTPAS